MPEVLTETITNYIHVTGPLGCVRCDYSTQIEHEAGMNYEGQQRVFDQHLNGAHPGWQTQSLEQFERARLEKAVVEKAKAYGRAARAVEDHMKTATDEEGNSRAGWQLLREMESTQEDLMLKAVELLLEFESQREK